MRSMKRYLLLVGISLVVIAGCGSPSVPAESTPEELGTAVAATLTALAPSPTVTLPPATASPIPEKRNFWVCFGCSGDSLWQLSPGPPRLIRLPASMGEYYGYSPQSNRILMAAEFGDHGAGPGNVSVSDLSILNLGTGQVTQVFPDNVVEAEWGPDGTSFAYILATPVSYELRWRTEGGEDHLLASDVSFTWSVSPSGKVIAFTRETGYELDEAPGLFVVTVPDGRITKLSDADKAGAGSIVDRPAWSPDSREVIFSLWGADPIRLILARADGSRVFDLAPDPAAADVWWSGMQIPEMLWFPDGEHVLVNTTAIHPDAGMDGMGGTRALVTYRIDRSEHRLADGRFVGEAMGLIGWNVPGESFWSVGPEGRPESVSIAAAP